MIKIIITTIIVICFYLSFIIYCALAIKKPTPYPDQNFMGHIRSDAA
jgi:hypothetical protein